MADPASSQHRAQLIREMSKDMNRTRNSSDSSRDSQGAASPEPTTSNFDPENEAIMSTRQLESQSQQLPELRNSARRYSRFSPTAEPDFAINTSAIGRAFPDFSQCGTSSEEDSMSIEVGRGAKKSSTGTIGKLGRSREYSTHVQSSLDDGDSMDFSAPMIGNYEVTATPPLKQRQPSKIIEDGLRRSSRHDSQARKPSGLQNEISDPSPPPAKTKDYGSGENRKGSGGSRRTLSSMHARARDENDQSRNDDERPPTMDLTARNTRFGNTKNLPASSQGTLPTRFSSAQTLLNSVAPVNKRKMQSSSTPNQGTQQSFMLPDLPNISELVSGVFEDGTPVFSRHGKSRASRFVSASQHDRGDGREFAGVHEIPVPDDEQAIFLSLKLLQDKVATLEKSNAEAANTVDELQQRNQVLENEKSNRRRAPRSDSALGTTDSDGGHETSGGQRKLMIEKNRLEASAKALQQQVDAGQRKYVTAETILKQITQERDSAVSQLGVAFVTIEQLKAENENLKNENNELRLRLEGRGDGCRDETRGLTGKEKSLRNKPNPTIRGVKASLKAADPRKSSLQYPKGSSRHAQGPTISEQRNNKLTTHKDADTMFDLSSGPEIKNLHAESEKEDVRDGASHDSEDSACDVPQRKRKDRTVAQSPRPLESGPNDDTKQDLTYLSFLDNREIAQLRKTLEQERIERKQRQKDGRHPAGSDPTVTHTGFGEQGVQSSQKAPPRKSSMKDLTTKSIEPRETTGLSQHPALQADDNRRHSDSSILSIRSRRRGMDAGNMTSAFIVPDITIRQPGTSSSQVPKLTEKGQELIDSLAAHNGRNCTVCKRVLGANEEHEHDGTKKETITIPKPVPVSERMPKGRDEDGDPTIRPAQAPGLALATVLKELEDELAHSKIQLSQYQTLFNGHDPALSKRQRKSVQQKIESLLQAIDVKADQIYALYDVLEGQKQDGHEVSEEEFEITLQSIGVKAPELHLRGGGDKEREEENEKPTERHPWDLGSDGESSEELPWEGIESTVETTKSGFARAARRRSLDA